MDDAEVMFQSAVLCSMALDLQPVPSWIGLTYSARVNLSVKALDFVQDGGFY